MSEFLYETFLETGSSILTNWLVIFVLSMSLLSASRIFTQIKKIQGRKSQWTKFRHELLWSTLNLAGTTIVLKTTITLLVDRGFIVIDPSPISWYVIALEFLIYFFVYDFGFYVVHRLIHIEPLYTWIHKTHHQSTTPNPLSSASMNPLEGILEGLVIPLILAIFTFHEASMVLLIPFTILMGLYVHCGYEVVPRWWYKHPATSWIITPMFHDQHHQYFTANYGAFTTIWDRVFGTVRPRFYKDFDKLKGNTLQEEGKIQAV